MRHHNRWCRLSGALAILLVALAIESCSIVRASRPELGVEVERVQAGIKRHDVETILGLPVRSWESPLGIKYSLYDYDAGRPASGEGAVGMALFDLISLGFWEVIAPLAHEEMFPHHRGRIIVSYDENDEVLGAFREFDELPADGLRRTGEGLHNPLR